MVNSSPVLKFPLSRALRNPTKLVVFKSKSVFRGVLSVKIFYPVATKAKLRCSQDMGLFDGGGKKGEIG